MYIIQRLSLQFVSYWLQSQSYSVTLTSDGHSTQKAKAIIISDVECKSVAFQLVDKGHVLANKKWLISRDGTLTKGNDIGLILRESISCLYTDGDLYFKSYRDANLIFGLDKYLEMASDEAVEAFVSCQLVSFEDKEQFMKDLNWQTRRSILLAKKSGMMDAGIETIRKIVEENELPFQIIEDKILIPKDKKSRNNVMNFLTERMFATFCSKSICVSNSTVIIHDRRQERG